MLGQLIERETISIPDYPALLQPSVSVGKIGLAEGELNCPCGVAFDEKSKLIYVADGGSFITTGNISVFSIRGEKIRFSSHVMTRGMLKYSYATHYVSTRDRISLWLIIEF